MNNFIEEKDTVVLNKFNNATIDRICAYVSLPFSKKYINDDKYLVIGEEVNNDNKFVGVIIDKNILKQNMKKYKTYYILNLRMSDKAAQCVIKSDNYWQKEYLIGVLDICTTIRKYKGIV